MGLIQTLALIVAAFAIAALVAAQFGLFSGRPPKNLGVRDGKLKPPSKTPNSVSSHAHLWHGHAHQHTAQVAPLALRGDGAATIARLKTIVEAMPRMRVIEARADYLHVTFTTRRMKFVDDTEFWFDPAAAVIQVRSASRVGRRDFDVNRQRVEHIRTLLAAH